MTDRPRTDQEQWAADLFRLLGFDVKMNHWPRETPNKIEIDVWARLGPLQIAVECKKYNRETVGSSDIEYFHDKLQMLGPALGIFVANSFSDSDLRLCSRLGILPLTSEAVLGHIGKLQEDTAEKRYLMISARTWELLAAVMRFAQDWRIYLDPSWPFHDEIYATQAFEARGLIETQSDFGDFQYKHTEAGVAFFGHLGRLLDVLESEHVTAMNRIDRAASVVVEICGPDPSNSLSPGYDRLVMQGLGLQDTTGQPTAFATKLASVVEEAVLRSGRQHSSCQ